MRTVQPFVFALLLAACGGAPLQKPPQEMRVVSEETESFSPIAGTACRAMTRERLEESVVRIATVTEGGGGVLAAVYDEVPMLVVSDPRINRMRIVSPIVEASELRVEELAIMTEANFRSALDARYATSDGVLYAAYIHPLSTLAEEDLESAMRQVAALVRNFRSTWSSDEMSFGRGVSTQEFPLL